MPFDNGTGQGGGNGSVWWSVGHRTPPKLANELRRSSGAAAAAAVAGLAAKASSKLAPFGESVPLGPADLTEVKRPLTPGEVKLGRRVDVHDGTDFDVIGVPDHKGCFRVVLRFRPNYLEKLSKVEPPTATAQMVKEFAKPYDKLVGKYDSSVLPDPGDGSVFLELDVPAIRREQPEGDAAWERMPWEVVWGW